MFTDTVGFSAAAQSDESGALRRLREQSDLVLPVLEQFHGGKIKSTGDGFRVEFDNALRATECAVEIQRRLHDRNSHPDSVPIEVRIGIHLGDVEEEGEDILGDTVNIASRIEPTADPGGVCVSGPVFDQVHSKVTFQFEKLKPRPLKGIRDPIEIYRVVFPWQGGTPSPKDLPANRIAVLPFVNISPDPRDEYFADGLTAETITELSKARPLRVIAWTSVMRYKGARQSVVSIAEELNVGTVLEGSVRKAGSRIRITAQLIDGRTEEHLWSETFDRDFDDIFAVQSQIAKNVTAALHLALASPSVAVSPPMHNLDAYSLYLKGRALWTTRSNESVMAALRCFEEARKLDPGFAQAYAGIADCYSILADSGWMDWSEIGSTAIEAARGAVSLDAKSAAAHASLGLALTRQYEWEAAEREFLTAIDLSPGYAPAHHWYYLLLRTQLRQDEASVELARAMDADPLSPIIWTHFGIRAWLAGDDQDALARLDRALELEPRFEMAYVYKVFLHADRGQTEAALDAFSAFEKLDPEKQQRNVYYGLLLVALGRRDQARNWLDTNTHDPRNPTVHPMAIAWTYGALGETDRCYEWLFRGRYYVRAGIIILLTQPLLEGVRDDPRFQEFLRRCRLAT